MYLRNIECQPQKMRILNGRILKIIFITEQLRKNYESAESDRKLLITEMQRLRTQYEDLIKQLEQTQVIVDQQKVPVLWYTLSPRTFFQLVYCTSEYGSSQVIRLNTHFPQSCYKLLDHHTCSISYPLLLTVVISPMNKIYFLVGIRIAYILNVPCFFYSLIIYYTKKF